MWYVGGSTASASRSPEGRTTKETNWRSERMRMRMLEQGHRGGIRGGVVDKAPHALSHSWRVPIWRGDKRVWSSGIDRPHPCSSGRTRNRARQARRGLRNAEQNKAASSRASRAGGARASGRARACMAYADMRATYNVGHDVSNEQTTIRCGCFCAGDGRRALLLLAKPNGPAWVVPERLMSERDE